MNMKTWLPLALALVLGVFALKLGRDWMAKNKGGDTNNTHMVSIVIAKQPIGAGEALSSENCTIGHVAPDTLPDSAYTSIDGVQGRVAATQLGKGQAISDNLLTPTGTGTGLQAIIPQGMRAISIEINEFSGVGGMLIPGAHVDLIATVQSEVAGEMISRTVVQNVEISAVGQRMVKQPDKKSDEPVVFRSVTLMATPTEAEAIELAATNGRPRLVLRNNNDKEFTNTPGVTAANLRGSSARKGEQAYTSIKAIRGTVESEVRFDSSLYGGTAKATTPSDKPADGRAPTLPMTTGADTTPAVGGAH